MKAFITFYNRRESLVTAVVHFRCNNCRHRFEAEVLNEDGRHEARRPRTVSLMK